MAAAVRSTREWLGRVALRVNGCHVWLERPWTWPVLRSLDQANLHLHAPLPFFHHSLPPNHNPQYTTCRYGESISISCNRISS